MKKITKMVPVLFLMLFFVFVPAVNADTVVRSGETVSVPEEQVVEGDFYSVAGKINISGKIEEDLVVAGGQVTLNGSVGDNAFLIAGQTEIHGTVGDDLRIIAGETTIAEPVNGDVLVLGGTVNILSTASVSGDVLIFAGNATIEGSVGGDVLGTIGVLRIDAPIAGDVDVTVEELTLGDRANVSGSVRYVSSDLAVQSINAIVVGDLVRNDPVLPGSQPNIQAALVPVFVLLFSVLVWFLVSRKSLTKVVQRALTKSLRPVTLGLATLLFTPLAFMLLFMSMIGTLVSIAVLSGYILLASLSVIVLSAVLGQLLSRLFSKPVPQVTLLSLVVGVVGTALLMLLPVIGQISLFILMVISLGAMVDILIRPTTTE